MQKVRWRRRRSGGAKGAEAPPGPRSGTNLAVDFDLLLPVLVDVPDEIVHLPHQLQVAEGQFVRGHPEHVPHGRKRPGK